MTKIELRVLGKRGRTTIPYSIRRELDYRPGDLISFTVNEDDSVTLRQEFLCEDENCPINDDPSLTEISAETVLEDYSELTPAQQRTVLTRLISAWAGNNHYYILDLSNGALGGFANMPHCGAYLSENEETDFFRLLDLIKEMIGERKRRFAEAKVTTFDAYSHVSKLPLVLVILDGYTNIATFNPRRSL